MNFLDPIRLDRFIYLLASLFAFKLRLQTYKEMIRLALCRQIEKR